MTTTPARPCIVVGYDGSPAARAALALAVERAAGRRLYIVHAFDAPADLWGVEHARDVLDRALARGEQLLAGVDEAEPRLADVEYDTELIPGSPAEVVATVADVRKADEIIVGTRGFGRVRAVLGSVAHELLHVAPCPVTVIPERVVANRGAAAPQTAGVTTA